MPRYDSDIRAAVGRFWTDGPDWTWWKAQLFQESRLDPAAVSPVGARGLAQFMPGTWADVTRELGWGNVSPHSPRHAIFAGAYYMRKLQRAWSSERTVLDRQKLSQASYNGGMGNILQAQKRCGGAVEWERIAACLPQITGRHAAETLTYVDRIARWQREMSQ